eukprot:GDKK01076553.1.p1 GENE.GDKK01076553.1~~GDKK01076553.1.p1  ORF type:complete len:127 (-),score=25.02 GDKK01076553.1:22-381(-)
MEDSNFVDLDSLTQKTFQDKVIENRDVVVLVELRAKRNAAQLKNSKLKCKNTDRVLDIVNFIRSNLKLEKDDPLYVYIQRTQSQPLLEESLADILISTSNRGAPSKLLHIEYSYEPEYS